MSKFSSFRKRLSPFRIAQFGAFFSMLFFSFAGSVSAGDLMHPMWGCGENTLHSMSEAMSISNACADHAEKSPFWCTVECLKAAITLPTTTTLAHLFFAILFAIIPLLVASIVPPFNIASFSFARTAPPPQRPFFLSVLKRE